MKRKTNSELITPSNPKKRRKVVVAEEENNDSKKESSRTTIDHVRKSQLSRKSQLGLKGLLSGIEMRESQLGEKEKLHNEEKEKYVKEIQRYSKEVVRRGEEITLLQKMELSLLSENEEMERKNEEMEKRKNEIATNIILSEGMAKERKSLIGKLELQLREQEKMGEEKKRIKEKMEKKVTAYEKDMQNWRTKQETAERESKRIQEEIDNFERQNSGLSQRSLEMSSKILDGTNKLGDLNKNHRELESKKNQMQIRNAKFEGDVEKMKLAVMEMEKMRDDDIDKHWGLSGKREEDSVSAEPVKPVVFDRSEQFEEKVEEVEELSHHEVEFATRNKFTLKEYSNLKSLMMVEAKQRGGMTQQQAIDLYSEDFNESKAGIMFEFLEYTSRILKKD